MAPRNLFDAGAQLPPGLGAWMSSREGGHSSAPWDSFNMGDHVGDVPGHVLANRQLLADTLGVRPVFLQQVHGTAVLEIGPHTPDGAVADACFAFEAGVACTIMVADCLPVLLWDREGRWVAAAHAGWRGLAGEDGQGVLENLWGALAERGARADRTRVWLGPCIGLSAFEVGPDVLAAFGARPDQPGPRFIPATRPDGTARWLADLPGLARDRLLALGLPSVTASGLCTVSDASRFFSFRRDGVTGRMAACIWRRG